MIELAEGDTAVAAGAATYQRDWLGIRGLGVDPDPRRLGLGTAARRQGSREPDGNVAGRR